MLNKVDPAEFSDGDYTGPVKLLKDTITFHIPDDKDFEGDNAVLDFSPERPKNRWKMLHNAIFNNNFSKNIVMKEFLKKSKYDKQEKVEKNKSSDKRSKSKLSKNSSNLVRSPQIKGKTYEVSKFAFVPKVPNYAEKEKSIDNNEDSTLNRINSIKEDLKFLKNSLKENDLDEFKRLIGHKETSQDSK